MMRSPLQGLPVDKKLQLFPLVATLFFVVSGGPNGLEDIVRQSGPVACLVLLIITPLIWSLPCALMTAELTSAIPSEGGYYIWVSRSLGPFWGFTCACWSWIATWFDLALYPVLAVALLRQAGLTRWADHLPFSELLLTIAVVIPFVMLNALGVRKVGGGSLLLGFMVLAPFLVLSCIAFLHPTHLAHLASFNPEHGWWGSLGVGLSTCMWNYLGWDNLSTVASEVEEPQKAYPRAIALTLPAIVAVYVLVVLAALAVFPGWQKYESGIWVQIAQKAGGWPLFAAVLAAGIASSLGQFNGMLLSVSRIPFVLAEDRYLPKALTWIHPRFGTPVIAIGFCTVLTVLFSLKGFAALLELEVLFYGASLILEFFALVVLRRTEPDLERPYKIPWGNFGLALTCLPPITLVVVTFALAIGHLEPFKLGFLAFGFLFPPLVFRSRSVRSRTA